MESRTKIFIGSSVEGKRYAECIGRILKEQGNIDPLLWWDRACFPANSTAIESLENIVAKIDGAILIATPGDRTFQRGEEKFRPSVNVMLEYGFFLGFLGRVRVAIARVEEADLPTDLAGVTYIHLPKMEGSTVDTTYERLTAAPSVVAWLERLADTPDLGRRLSPHLQAIYERSKGNLRVIIPAFKIEAGGDSTPASTESSMVTMMTSVEGMAYGWLLKAFSPIMKGGQKIECLTAYQGQTFAQGVATFLIGAPSTNENTKQIFSRWYQSDMATQASTKEKSSRLSSLTDCRHATIHFLFIAPNLNFTFVQARLPSERQVPLVCSQSPRKAREFK
jgi:hypothetical protein